MLLSQVGTLEEYTAKFDTLRHQILLADPHTHEIFFVGAILLVFVLTFALPLFYIVLKM